MYNSFHTALSRGSGRIEDACGESPAASLLWLRSLGEVQIIRSLFVLIRALCKRSHPKDMARYLGTTFGSLGSILGSLEAILGALEGILGGLGGGLGASWGALGGVLGGSWAVLWRSWVDILSSQFFN